MMIPCKPDHPYIGRHFPYAAGVKYGVKIYTYQNGFIHSKVMMIDDENLVSVQLIKHGLS